MALLEDLATQLEPEEGWSARPYYDSRHILSIAYGFNLTRPDADALLKRLGLSPTLVRAGAQLVSREQGALLLAWCAEGAIADARKVIGSETWDALPDEAKLVFADMAYNMGAGGLSEFRLAIAALRRKPLPDYFEVERQLDASLWDRQVGVRADRLEAIIHALIPHLADEDRTRVAGLFVPARPEGGAHADDGALDGQA